MGRRWDFRVLGSVELRVDGVPLDVGGRKRRSVLAILLLRADDRVSASELAQAAWPADPPASAQANMRTYLADLRRLFATGDPGDQRLRTVGGGAVLTVRPGELDAARFTAMVDRARVVAAHDPRTAARLLGDAVALWRGPVGDGLTQGPLLDAEATRLNDAHARAVEERADLLLDLGDHDTAADELRRLLVAHPLREGAWRRLVTAHWRRGDTAAALAEYRRARSRLAEDLGIEPAAELREAHRAILAGEAPPPRPPRHPAGRPAASPRPSQAPRRRPGFVGRTAEFEELAAHVRGSRPPGTPAVCVLHGPAGVGKSALALELVHRLGGEHPDGCLHADLRGSDPARALDPAAVLGRFLRALGSTDHGCADADEAAARFRSATTGLRLLVVLDDAADTRQVSPLLPADASCAVVVTSRRRLAALDGARHLDVGPLSRAESISLLAASAGAERLEAEPDAVTDLVDRCDGLPLAVRIMAGRLAATPSASVRAFADRLADAGRRLDELVVEDLAVRSTFDVAYHALRASDPAAARAFCLLGLSGLPVVPLPAVAALLRRTPDDAEHVVERLVDVHLVETATDGRYRMHDLLRLHAAERAVVDVPAADADAAVLGLLRHYRTALADATTRLATEPDEAGAWLRSECDALLALVGAHADAAPPVAAVVGAIAEGLLPYLDRARHRRDLVETGTVAMRLADARGDTAAMASTRLHLAWAHAMTDLDTAYQLATASRDLSRAIGDERGEAAALQRLGGIHRRGGRFDLAVDALRRAVALFRRAGDRAGEVRSLDNLGVALQDAGAVTDALRCHERAVDLAATLGDQQLEALCLLNAANVYRLTDRLVDAETRYRRVLLMCRRFGNRRAEASALLGLGVCLRELDRRDEARPVLEQSVRAFDDLGLPGAALARAHLAGV